MSLLVTMGIILLVALLALWAAWYRQSHLTGPTAPVQPDRKPGPESPYQSDCFLKGVVRSMVEKPDEWEWLNDSKTRTFGDCQGLCHASSEVRVYMWNSKEEIYRVQVEIDDRTLADTSNRTEQRWLCAQLMDNPHPLFRNILDHHRKERLRQESTIKQFSTLGCPTP